MSGSGPVRDAILVDGNEALRIRSAKTVIYFGAAVLNKVG